jgi:hypothetical protein
MIEGNTFDIKIQAGSGFLPLELKTSESSVPFEDVSGGR